MPHSQRILSLVLALILAVPALADDPILKSMGELESRRDPKCYATAARLEDFMYGTPLTEEARFRKNELHANLARAIWAKASEQAAAAGAEEVSRSHVMAVRAQLFTLRQADHDRYDVIFADQLKVPISFIDLRHYGSIAYGLRALLAVRQELMLSPDPALLPLSDEAVEDIKSTLDLFSLSVLYLADQEARQRDLYHLEKDLLEAAWLDRLPEGFSRPGKKPGPGKTSDSGFLEELVKKKVAAYAAYNDINNTLFLRNLQVYFARATWPADQAKGDLFKERFTQMMVEFSRRLYLSAQQRALADKALTLREKDVHGAGMMLVPHRINQYEDALFFFNLPREEQVALEAYDMDSFRDSGVHWRYLQFAWQDHGEEFRLQADPFALELLVENIAQYGVLLMRLTGEQVSAAEAQHLDLPYLEAARILIDERAAAHHQAPLEPAAKDTLASSGLSSGPEQRQDTYFNDITQAAGVDWAHRSSDWLNRLLRSYLPKGKDVGVITIPPAFGGGGIAAEDINHDGLPDLLVLSGLGNKLYLNRGEKGFEDATEASGLNWIRAKDKRPGEPRQPLIADLDNDGHQDVIITYVNDAHRVYRGNGDGTFVDVTGRAGLGGKNLVGGPATVFDFDRDGLLDIYITYFGDYLKGVLPTLKRYNDNGLPNQLFRNKGGFKFENVTRGSGVDNTGWGQAVIHTDLDGDGWQDLIVGNDFGVNSYYRNKGDGTFEDIGEQLGTKKPSYTMSLATADLNDDLVPDIYVSNIVTMNKDEKYVAPSEETVQKFNPDKLGTMRVVEANDLFLSGKGEGKLPGFHLSSVVGRGYNSTGWAWDADFFDVDNDGDDDLYVLNGMNEFNLYSSTNPYFTDKDGKPRDVYIPVSTKESNVFFLNHNGKLNNVSAVSGADLLGNSRSCAYFDLEGDGDPDMALNDYHGPVTIYRNNGERLNNGWVKVRLVGDPAKGVSRDAIGAKLVARTPDGGMVMREVQSSTGYMSVHPKQQTFGLGKNPAADLTITWPNGEVMEITGIPAGRSLTVYQTPPK